MDNNMVIENNPLITSFHTSVTLFEPMRSIEFSSIVEASLTEVWHAWTHDEGVRGFFAPDSKIELCIGGAYELYFDLDAAEGSRGSEGMKIQTYVPERILAFDWNQPPSMPSLRHEKTWVVIEFTEMDDELCEVTLTHMGFLEGPEWEAAYQYFMLAWPKILKRFERAMCLGMLIGIL